MGQSIGVGGRVLGVSVAAFLLKVFPFHSRSTLTELLKFLSSTSCTEVCIHHVIHDQHHDKNETFHLLCVLTLLFMYDDYEHASSNKNGQLR